MYCLTPLQDTLEMQNRRSEEETSGSQGLEKGAGGRGGEDRVGMAIKTATKGLLVGWECSVP